MTMTLRRLRTIGEYRHSAGRELAGCSISTIYEPMAALSLVGWLVSCFKLKPFETAFQSIPGRLSESGRKKRGMIDGRKNVQTTPPAPTEKRSRPLPYSNPN